MKKLILITLAFLFAKGLPKAKALTLTLALALALALPSFAQNISITDDDGYSADPSAMLDVKSTTKGMLVPRVTSLQRDALSNPANGLLVFDTDENNFYFHNGAAWINLSSDNPNALWGQDGNRIFLNDTTYNLGIGTHTPEGKLEVKADATNGVTEAIFGVINNNGDTVFAVYPEGVRINVADDDAKAVGSKSGFAVGGFSLTKGATAEYLRVTPDSVRIYVEESTDSKVGANKGGFAIGGFSLTKGLTNEYLKVTDDSVRVYIDKDGGSKATASKGGFAIGGFSLTKSIPDDYFNISGADSSEVINPAEARILWYPIKKALLTGTVLIESVDSVGTNSMATGFESKAIGDYSQAFGYNARVYGSNSTAIGNNANVDGKDSYAFGNYAYVKDTGSYAFGSGARANGQYSFAVGSYGVDSSGTLTNSTTAEGDYSFAFGMGSVSDNLGAMTFGTQDTATGKYALAMGYQTKAKGYSSTAVCGNTIAQGSYSFAAGNRCNALGTCSFTAGQENKASGYASTALGWLSEANSFITVAIGQMSIAEGYRSIAIGRQDTASGSEAIAIGTETVASGDKSTTLGYKTRAEGLYSIAMGSQCTASDIGSLATGYSTTASGRNSTAMGLSTTASGWYAMAFGVTTTASGYLSTTFGYQTKASGSYTTAMGYGIEAQGTNSFAIALSNQSGIVVTEDSTMAIMGGRVGIGTVTPDKLLHVAGDARIEGDIYYGIGNNIYTKPDFVFEKNYDKKMDIDEVEVFVAKNQHLPWLTSAKNENDGVNFTRMGFETLEAVENLQMQIIELNKENQNLKAEIKEIKSILQSSAKK